MSKEFEGKVVVITGAGKGLGRGYARFLARLGAKVVVNNRKHAGESDSSADNVVAEIKQAGGTAIAEYSSVENPDAGRSLLERSLDTFGRLDAVIANAGVSEGVSFHKQKLEEFQRVMDINLMGTVNILHPAFCHMYEQRHGSMLVSSSVAGLYGEFGLPSYSASKAALLGLMYSLSTEGASHGLRINALAPFGATNMTNASMPPAMQEQMKPERVAPVAAWLISDDCKLNGETIVSGGGRISRARVMETRSVGLPADADSTIASLQSTWELLNGSPLDQSYRGALDQFGKFIAE